MLDFAFLSSVEFKVTFFSPRRDESISKALSPGQADKLPHRHSAVTAPASGMCQTKSEDVMNRKVETGRRGEKESEAEDDCKQMHIPQPKKSFTQGNIWAISCVKRDYSCWTFSISVNVPSKSYSVFCSTRSDKVSELQPKSSMVEDDLEATFMIRLLNCLFLRVIVYEQKSSKVTALG